MNTEPQRTVIIDPATGKVITVVPLNVSVGPKAFQQAESVGHRFADGKVYLHIPVNRHGAPITTDAATVWRYIAPSKSSAEQVTL